jgi:predicted GNAT family N-acyltransferase
MDNFSIIEQPDDRQTIQLLDLIRKTWWGGERTLDNIKTMLNSCMSFGLVENSTQDLIGYARVLTDEIKYAFIFDVVVDESFRGKGFGDLIMRAIFSHPKLVGIKNFELTCAPDMMGYYKRFGFSEDFGSVRAMRYSKIN